MRVVIAKKLLSSVGGSELQARALAAALRGRGHDITVVGMRPAWRRPGIPDEAFRAGGGTIESRVDGVTLRFVPTRLGRLGAALDGLLPTSLPDERALREAVADADVLHCLAREWAGPLERAARAMKVPYVETPLVHPGQAFGGAGRADLARYRRADCVVALTEWEAEWYRSRGVERAVWTGVGPILAPLPALPREPQTILFVGRKERYKGYDALAGAAPLVWKRRPGARFVAIGQRRFLPPPPPRDRRWEERGVVSEAEKAEAYARATIFAMPSEHETFGHTYIEAWAAGLPVIGGDIPPVREIVRNEVDGLLVPNRAADVASAILRLLADPERARRMGASGRKRAEAWSWPRIAARTEAAYALAGARV